MAVCRIGKRKGSPGGAKRRLEVIRESAAEVVPAVITAVSTTIVSFLPVFFLTGRDHRLFAPLAWTKTFALASSLIVAVVVVPMLVPNLSQDIETALVVEPVCAGLGFGVISAALCQFVWGHHIQSWASLSLPLMTTASAAVGFIVGWWMSRERVRPIEENPVSRFVLVALRRPATARAESKGADAFASGHDLRDRIGRLDWFADRPSSAGKSGLLVGCRSE